MNQYHPKVYNPSDILTDECHGRYKNNADEIRTISTRLDDAGLLNSGSVFSPFYDKEHDLRYLEPPEYLSSDDKHDYLNATALSLAMGFAGTSLYTVPGHLLNYGSVLEKFLFRSSGAALLGGMALGLSAQVYALAKNHRRYSRENASFDKTYKTLTDQQASALGTAETVLATFSRDNLFQPFREQIVRARNLAHENMALMYNGDVVDKETVAELNTVINRAMQNPVVSRVVYEPHRLDYKPFDYLQEGLVMFVQLVNEGSNSFDYTTPGYWVIKLNDQYYLKLKEHGNDPLFAVQLHTSINIYDYTSRLAKLYRCSDIDLSTFQLQETD